MFHFVYDLVVLQPHVGGDINLKVAPFATSHYAQDDVSLNRKLWAVVPTEMTRQERKLAFGAWEIPKRIDGPPYNSSELQAHTIKHEEWAIVANLDLVEQAWEYCVTLGLDAGSDPNNVLRNRGRVAGADAVRTLVEQVSKRKKKANDELFSKKKYGAALLEYYHCILSLYPWLATPLIFSAEEAFETGIAQLEAFLWCNMSITGFKLHQIYGHPVALQFSLSCAEAVINMRYATPAILGKAYARAHLAALQRSKSPPTMFELSDDDLIGLYKIASTNLNNPTSREWTHKDCINHHVCMSPAMDVHARKAEASASKVTPRSLRSSRRTTRSVCVVSSKSEV